MPLIDEYLFHKYLPFHAMMPKKISIVREQTTRRYQFAMHCILSGSEENLQFQVLELSAT
jgi:hypothetical protein